ncbi:MAG: DUF1049 domain-containing protein [Alphaproteobacteria bacterium]|nr:DUF1049 domain-containing protein [Alphaproteobacteria bacterium]
MSSLKRFFGFLFLLFLAASFVVFAVSNRDFVGLNFFPLPYVVEIPKFLLALLCFAVGLLIGALAISFRLARTRRLLRAECRRADALLNENKALRMETSDRLTLK